MKKHTKQVMAIFLTLFILAGSFSCLAITGEKEYYDYGSYVLLGDSVASGWSDVEDRETRFVRVEGSYGAHVADDLGVTYHPMACIGFRTVEMRYIFEDDFEGDRFLFYSIDKELMDNVHIPAMRKAVSEAGLVTLNIGGNDWGSFLGWHVFEEMDKQADKNEKFLAEVEAYLENAGTNESTIEAIIDIASLFGALPDIVKVLPKALKTGLDNYFLNWNYMIEDIYALNPDVTLLVIGMFDNSVQDQETADKNEAALLKLSVGQAIVDYANKPMLEGAEKYGYTFVDTTGTVCEEHHPSDEGHRYIADKILEALPDARFPYTDVEATEDYYKAIEYMYQTGIMQGVSETEFAPEESITASQLERALFAITEEENLIEKGDNKVTQAAFAFALFRTSVAYNNSIPGFVEAFSLLINTLFAKGTLGLGVAVSRAEAAVALAKIVK